MTVRELIELLRSLPPEAEPRKALSASILPDAVNKALGRWAAERWAAEKGVAGPPQRPEPDDAR